MPCPRSCRGPAAENCAVKAVDLHSSLKGADFRETYRVTVRFSTTSEQEKLWSIRKEVRMIRPMPTLLTALFRPPI
eukprot:1633461-Rhodomonas_salina.2